MALVLVYLFGICVKKLFLGSLRPVEVAVSLQSLKQLSYWTCNNVYVRVLRVCLGDQRSIGRNAHRHFVGNDHFSRRL